MPSHQSCAVKMTNVIKSEYNHILPLVMEIDFQFFPLPWSKNSWQDLYDVQLKNYELFILTGTHGQLMGFALFFVGQDLLELYKIVIDPAYRGHGYAAMLLSWSITQMRGRGSKCCLLEVSCENTEAIHLYNKLGFRILTRKNQFYSNNEDAFTMSLELE